MSSRQSYKYFIAFEIIKKSSISKQELKKLYLDKKLNTYQIAKMHNCSQTTIWKRLRGYKIKLRPSGGHRIDLTKEELENYYLKQKYSTRKIETLTKIPRSSIHRKLKEWKIPTRDISESHIIYPKKDFPDNEILKAYLIGFRIGDLRVRTAGGKQSKTIKTDCGSSISAQINLIKNLFQPFGHVWVSRKYDDGTYQIEAFLNESFSFLLSKNAQEYIFQQKDIFFSFLAGFVDAEGYIHSKDNSDFLFLGNYDVKLLRKIKRILEEKHKIKCSRVSIILKKGYYPSNDRKYNKDYWALRISRKVCLMRLLEELKKYSKHENKQKAITQTIKNIKRRNLLYGIRSKSDFYG